MSRRPWATEWICEACGSDVPRGSGRRRFCSDSCQQAASRGRPQSVPCQACGKAIDLSRRANGRLPRSDVAYCRDCRNTPAALRFKKYGITPDEFAEMTAEGCAICKRTDRDLHVDHDHSCCLGAFTCGECVRGVLCGPCNRAIGLLGDDPDLLAEARNYLMRGR